jgi:hypothetical protein
VYTIVVAARANLRYAKQARDRLRCFHIFFAGISRAQS